MKKPFIFLLAVSLLFVSGCGTEAKPYNASSVIDGTVSVELTAADESAKVTIQGLTHGGLYATPRLDDTSLAFSSIDIEHTEIHSGDTFTVLEVTDLGNGVVRDILIVTPNTTKWAHLVWEIEHELETKIQFYSETTYTDNGTSIAAFNRDGNSSKGATTLVYHTPTITDVGNLMATIQQGDGKKAGGADRESNEFILKQGWAYTIRITNMTVNDNLVFMKLNWYEHTNLMP